MRSFRVFIGCVAVLSAVALPRLAEATPTDINVLSTTYSTSLTTKIISFTDPSDPFGSTSMTIAHTTDTSPAPLDHTLQSSTHLMASATANLFAVKTATDARFDIAKNEVSDFSHAVAQTVVDFSPVADGLSAMTLNIVADGQSFFTTGLISLLDITTNAQLWAYQWAWGGIGNVPFTCCEIATIGQSQGLLASHQYALTIMTSSDANSDSQSSSVSVSGLHAVPEPASILLMGAGLALARRYRSRSRARA